MFESPDDLRRAGFAGFRSVRELATTRLAAVPAAPGVCVALRAGREAPSFLPVSPAGHFHGRDPTLPVAELADRWVPESCTLYIGKAGGSGTQATLRRRLATYIRHGQGARAARWGGRAIWQLADAHELLVAWRVLATNEPRAIESAMLDDFHRTYGRRPFANRTG